MHCRVPEEEVDLDEQELRYREYDGVSRLWAPEADAQMMEALGFRKMEEPLAGWWVEVGGRVRVRVWVLRACVHACVHLVCARVRARVRVRRLA
jgi:hypothetical protein